MIQLLRGTQSQLNSYSTIIPDGQPVFERDTGQLKIGTGSARYSSLPYVGSIFESSGGGSSIDTSNLGDYDSGYVDLASNLRLSWKSFERNCNPTGSKQLAGNLYTSDASRTFFSTSSVNGLSNLLTGGVVCCISYINNPSPRSCVPVDVSIESSAIYVSYFWDNSDTSKPFYLTFKVWMLTTN